MLVLSRRKDEIIMIGDDIKVTVVEVKGDQVRLGISAPRDISIYREEIYKAIQAENIEAAKLADVDLGRIGKMMKSPQKESEPQGEKPEG